jgi:hypothetical protein|tara:strand:+ start:381 stop:845 length:465 start_codon:yes stop_codon:yes gene_type:complete
MVLCVKIKDGKIEKYPYSKASLKAENPDTSFPLNISDELAESYGVYPVNYVAEPSHDIRTKKIIQDTEPSLVDGTWTVDWTIVDRTTEEIATYDSDHAITQRGIRNGLLSDTDIYGLTDVTMTDEMKTYRQSLRDLPTHENWPNLEDSDWPTKP